MEELSYVLQRAARPPVPGAGFDAPPWDAATPLELAHFHERSGPHRPRTRAKLLYDNTGLHLYFHVEDRYVRSVRTKLHDMVCRDSCVEFFVAPLPGRGYFNFEFNAGGALLLWHIEDHRRISAFELAKATALPAETAGLVRIRSSLPAVVEPEIAEPCTWTLEACIPYPVMESRLGTLTVRPGVTWRANFYKCGEETRYPHWASWSPIGAALNFHQPEAFAPLHFA